MIWWKYLSSVTDSESPNAPTSITTTALWLRRLVSALSGGEVTVVVVRAVAVATPPRPAGAGASASIGGTDRSLSARAAALIRWAWRLAPRANGTVATIMAV